MSTYPGYVELVRTFFNNYDWQTTYTSSLTNTYDASYDTYFTTGSSFPYPQTNSQSTVLRGLVTGMRKKILGTSTWLYELNIYNSKGRLIQVKRTNQTGGIDIQTTQYSWAGWPIVKVNKVQKGGTGAQTLVEVSLFGYDELGREIKTEKKVSNTLVASGAMPATYKIISETSYDALGKISTIKLGKSGGTANALETQNFDYNIRGWLLGVNRDYARLDNNARYFGFDLGYEKSNNGLIGGATYSLPRYDGNIEGTTWRSKGDGLVRKYDFDYDRLNRLVSASFKQHNGTAFQTSTTVDFSVSGITYDYNGNIKSMNQRGMVAGSATDVDQLTYSYVPGTNRINQIIDAANANTLSSKIGDFKYATKGTSDYSYDYNSALNEGNGNLTEDKNKGILSITYNELNLPKVITLSGSRTVTYTYDANGSKQKKEVAEPGQPTKTTLYVSNVVFQDNVLQALQFGAGRVRFKPATPTAVASLEYDYFLKDHVGNIRMVLTEAAPTLYYPAATVEGTFSTAGTAQANSMINYEKQFYGIDNSKVVSVSTPAYFNNNTVVSNISYPTGHSPIATAASTKMYRVRGNENRTGLEFLMKVMAGDHFDIYGKSYHTNTTTAMDPTNTTLLDLATIFGSFLGSPGTAAAGHGLTAGQLAAINPIGVMTPFIHGADDQSSVTPKAYINWILLDDQFKFVTGNYSRVGAGNSVKDHYTADALLQNLQNIAVTKNGYLFVYVSNESNFPVYFDNLQVVHKPGPIVEETHYYPFGLTMTGISSSSLSSTVPNRLKINGKEQQANEFTDGGGLDWSDFGARMYDNQIGRWMVQDPAASQMRGYSPYAYAFNNPIVFSDPDGNQPDNVIVLLQKPCQNHSSGHQAVLVGNDETGWLFYSKDGSGGKFASSGPGHSTIGKRFATLKEFKESEYNTFKPDYGDGKGFETSEKHENGRRLQRFSDGYEIVTTAEQDAKMAAAAETEAKKPYNLGVHDCTHVVTAALDAAGLWNGESSRYPGVDPQTMQPKTFRVWNFMPKSKQAAIEKQNKGTDVDEKLVPRNPFILPAIKKSNPPKPPKPVKSKDDHDDSEKTDYIA